MVKLKRGTFQLVPTPLGCEFLQAFGAILESSLGVVQRPLVKPSYTPRGVKASVLKVSAPCVLPRQMSEKGGGGTESRY